MTCNTNITVLPENQLGNIVTISASLFQLLKFSIIIGWNINVLNQFAGFIRFISATMLNLWLEWGKLITFADWVREYRIRFIAYVRFTFMYLVLKFFYHCRRWISWRFLRQRPFRRPEEVPVRLLHRGRNTIAWH